MQELHAHVKDMLFTQFACSPEAHVCIVYDIDSPLAQAVTLAYRAALHDHPLKSFLDFNAHEPEELIVKMNALKQGDCVVLVQSTSFRVSVYRWRLELFARKLKVIEHMRLSYMHENEFPTYVHSLQNDLSFYQETGKKLAALFRKTQKIKVECNGGSILEYDSTLEEPIINDGDYSEQENVGGGYPIGEIFSEPQDISKVNGAVEIYAFPGEDHKMRFAKTPFKITIKNGHVQEGDFPPEFAPLVEMMKGENADGNIPVREFGLGLNRAITAQNKLTEATAFERVTGLHLSLGMKHGVYQKKFKKQKDIQQRFHVDIFPDVKKIWLNDTLIFESGKFVV